jgi:acetyl esterase/lipase
MPSKGFEKVLELLREQVTQESQPLEQQRAEYEKIAKLFKLEQDIICRTVQLDHLSAEWIIPPTVINERVVLYLHGGGYVLGSMNTHREMVSRISRASEAKALLLEYRLAPEHPHPAAVEDSVAAYKWLLGEGFDPSRIVIAGDSAGGGLTVATAVVLRDRGEPLPAALVCISPWVDLEAIGESMTTKADVDPIVQRDGILEMTKAYLGGKDPRTPLAAPLYANLAGLPPMLIHVGESETLLDDSIRLKEKAMVAGVDVNLELWEDMFHVWHYFAAMMPEGQKAIDDIGKFIREHAK